MHGIKNKLYFGIIIVILLSAAAEISSHISFKKQTDLNERIIHSYEVLDATQNIQKLVIDMETGQRGSRATNDSRFLQPYHEGIIYLNPAIGKLKKLVSENQDQENKVVILEKNIAGILHFWKDKGASNSIPAKEQLESITNNEKLKTDEIRGNISDILQAEKLLLKEKDNRQNYLTEIAIWVSIAGTVLILAVIALLIAIFIRDLKSRRINIDHLNQLNKELVFQNEEKEKKSVELSKVNRMYAFISQINQTIVQVGDEKILFKAVCNIAIEFGKFNMAWIGFIDKEHKKIKLIESCNILPEDMHLFNGVSYSENGPQHFVVNKGKPFICNDIENEFALLDWRQYAAARGVNSFMVLPIRKEGAIVGTLNLYAPEKGLFDRQEIKLLEEAAGDISFALDVYEKDRHRKQMEHNMARSELQLNKAQAIAHFGSWEIDLTTGIADWSEEFCSIYGVDHCDNLHTFDSWVPFVHPEDMAYVVKVTKEARETLSDSNYYHRIVQKNGTVRYLYSQTQFELNNEGIPVSMHGVAHDITEMKVAEIERAIMVDDIIQRNNDLEQFSYIVSHNLRAPVANILGLANIRHTTGINVEEEKFITEGLFIAAQNLDTVIKDINLILDLKHVVNEKRVSVNLEDLLAEVKISIGNCANNESIKIISDFSGAEEITTIKSYLYSIFFNLISNSIKYKRPQIPAIIEITAVKTRTKILLNFKDNGLGIDLVSKGEFVFGLYKRFHFHTEGKGMGLFMVKTQVESLGGKITVTSEVNKGSEFRIEFEIDRKQVLN